MAARRRALQRGAAWALAALVLALALGGAQAVDCPALELSKSAPFVEGLRLEGAEGKHTCGTSATYKDCYNECICTRRNHLADSSLPDCMHAAFVPSHPRCNGQALCVQLTTISGVVPDAGATSGLAASNDRTQFDGDVGTRISGLGAWIEANASMLLNPTSCNFKDNYPDCQLECLLNPKCVAWMHGVDADYACTSDLLPCPNLPLKGCKRGYCLLFSAFYEVAEWKSNGEDGHPGNTVGVVPGRTNPSQGQTNPWVTPASIDVGDMYTGVVEEGTGLSRPTGAGFSLPALAFDFGGAVGGGRCDAAGNCAHNLPCDLFVRTVAECSELCQSTNEKAAATLSTLLGRPDVDKAALQAQALPTCKLYRWTEKEQACGASGMKAGECLLMDTVAAFRPRNAQDDALGRAYGGLDAAAIPKPPPPSPPPSPPPRPPPPHPPPAEPPVNVVLDIGIAGVSTAQFGPTNRAQLINVLVQNSGGNATAVILSISNTTALKSPQQRRLLAAGIVVKSRLSYPKREEAKARQFAQKCAAGGPGTAWVKQISAQAQLDSSSVKLQGQPVLLPPPPPKPSPPPRSPPPPKRHLPPPNPAPPRSGNGEGGSLGGLGSRNGNSGGALAGRTAQGRVALEVERAAELAAPPACASVFFALPKLVVGGTPYLAAFSDAAPGANAAFALAYCQQRDASFAAVGAIRRAVLPPALAAHAGAVQTYWPAGGQTCQGAACPFMAVVECVPAGAEPCAADAQGNIGVGNTGWHNVGHYNSGSHNLGSRNSGSGNIGDMNAGSACVGSYNTADAAFGFEGSGSFVAPALRR